MREYWYLVKILVVNKEYYKGMVCKGWFVRKWFIGKWFV
jgi:hypothetical protein